MPLVSGFGGYIHSVRINLGYSLRELASKAEISPSQLSKIERDLATPTEETISKLSYALNVEKEALMFLAGYVDKDLKEEIMSAKTEKESNGMLTGYDAVRDIFRLPIQVGLVSSTIKGALVNRISELGLREERAQYLAQQELSTNLTIEEQTFLNRELESAYELAMKRIIMQRKVGEQRYVQGIGRVSRGTRAVPVDQRNVDDDSSDRS